ncbi:MAG: phosphodiester glycosidase family protein [Verrucomicrobiaceae bacterium]|nr:phosphodiester glycosidase family protein [Verrucomicrobiaceae bacterium]
MLLRLPVVLIAVLLNAWSAIAAEPSFIEERQRDRSMANGCRLLQFTVREDDGDSVEFNLVHFEARQCVLRIIDQPSRSAAEDLEEVMPRIGALAGINGGFFTPEFTPLGLTISSGRRVGTWSRSSLLGGVVVVRSGRLLLLWRDEFQDSEAVTELLQAGPRLVNNGQPVSGLDVRASRPRTFIATDVAGRWLLGTTSHVSLAELAKLLASPGLVPGMEIARALNFDGGKSTGFWARLVDGSVVSSPEIATVRNFVALVPRKRG